MNSVTRIIPSTITNQPVRLIPIQSVIRAGVTLNSITAKPMAIANAKISWPRVSSVDTSSASTPSSPSCWAA